MKLLIVLSLVALVVTAPPPPPRLNYDPNNVQVINYENDNIGVGNYRFLFEQNDGTKHEQRGELRNEGREDEYLAVKGSYEWVGPDGVKYIVTYVADEKGFQPEIEEGPGGVISNEVLASLVG